MRLTDRVEIVDAGGAVLASLPAQVGYGAELQDVSGATGAALMEYKLQAIVPPNALVLTADKVRWRGQTYAYQGDVRIYRQNGRDHHYTITLGNS